MADDQNQDVSSPQVVPQSPEVPTIEAPTQSSDSSSTDMPPVAPEASRDAVTPVSVEDQNGAVKQADTIVPAPSFLHDLLLRARAKIQDRKKKKLDTIMAKLTTKNKISNDDVQKLLYVSDATATRYLSILEQQGKIQQAGRTGKSVFYAKV